MPFSEVWDIVNLGVFINYFVNLSWGNEHFCVPTKLTDIGTENRPVCIKMLVIFAYESV